VESKGATVDIGKEKTTIIVEPIEEPVVRPIEEPRPAEPEKTPAEEPVPA
jgi:hypothetical protein